MSEISGGSFWRRMMRSPYFWLALPIVWVIVAYIVYPFSSLIRSSVVSGVGENLTAANYAVFFDLSSPYFLAFLRSLKVSVVVVILTTAFGTGLAHLLTRYQFPGRGLMYAMAVMPLVTPGFVAAYAYVMLYGRFGLITRLGNLLFTGHLGEALFFLDQYAGVVAVQTVGLLPFMFLTISACMSRVDPAMEEAALSLGASRRRTFFKVTFPLLAPGIAAGAILVVSRSIADFGSPLFMEYEAFTVAIFKAKEAGQANIAAAMSVILSLVSLAVLYAARVYLDRREFVSSRQRAVRTPEALRGWRRAGAAGVAGLLVVIMLLPLAMVILMSFTDVQRWSVKDILPPGLHLKHYCNLFRGSLLRAFQNTMVFATVCTVLCLLYGTAVAYLLSRRSMFGRKTLDAIVSAPYIIPSTVVGVAYIAAFNRETMFSFGTVWVATPVIIVAAMFIRRSAYVIRSVVASFQQMDVSVEEAALSLGASWAYAFRRVTLPMVKPGLVAGGMLCFVTAVSELSTTILLYTSKTQTIPVTLYQLVYNSEIGQASALGMVQVALVLAALLILNRTVGLRSLRV